MTRTVLPYGDRAILVEVDSLDEVADLFAALGNSRPAGVIDIVPGARTVGVTVDPSRLPLSVVHRWVQEVPALRIRADDSPTVVLEVDYSGPDLDEVATLLQLSRAELIELHTGSLWRVAFCGFAPGFGYLVTDHDRLTVPRRAAPRPTVPAGSVGLAGEFSGVYPRASPGGWQLIGVTDAVLWDSASPRPALLTPGTQVRFRSI
jgi:KipI family sensor histidine kinase inhibitor